MSRIGKYEIQGEIGRGGFGLVLRGFDPAVGRPVAIKVLTSEGDESLSTRFRNEAAAAGKLRHKNIVTVYEFGEHKGRPFLVMEYLEGEDLAHIIAAHKPLTLLEKVGIMSQVAAGLQCAHENGVIHRDVKPANIMVLPDGTVKIMDFGIARVLREDGTRLTRKGDMIGTMLYMSPEQFTSAEVDALCDIFAYGAIYYELLAGKHPFRAADAAAMMYKITVEDPEPIRAFAPDCPHELDDLVSRALQKDRDLRYQSMREVQVDAEPILLSLRQERAAQLAVNAQSLLDSGDPEGSRKLVLEALNLDPGNRAARQIREVIQKSQQRAAIQPRIEAFLKTAADEMSARRFAEAIQALESALRLDRANPEVVARLDEARDLLDRTRKAARLIVEARRAYQQQSLDAARDKLREALREDPGNPEAPAILTRLEDEIRAREEARKLKESLARASSLLAGRSFDEAVELLTALAAQHPQSEEAGAMLTRARSEKAAHERRQRLHAELAAATDILQVDRFEEAVTALEAIVAEFPGEQEAADLLAYARRKLQNQRRLDTVRTVTAGVAGCVQEQKFDEALHLIGEGLRAYPAESGLLRLLESTKTARAEWEREQAILAACHGGEEAIERGELEQAIDHLKRASTEYPGEKRLAALLERADRAMQARREEIAAICAKARALADSASFDAAMEAVAEAAAKYPREEQLDSVRDEIAAARQAWEREQEIQAICEAARARIAAEDFEAAIALLREAGGRRPKEKRISGLLEQAEQGRAAQQRAAAIARIRQQAHTLYDSREFGAAEALVREALSQFPEEQPLRELLADIHEQQKRLAAIEALCSEAEKLRAAEDYDRALAVALGALESYPGESRLVELVQSATRSREEWRRKRTRAAFDAAGKLLRARRYDEALALLRERMRECGEPAELAALLEQAEKRRSAAIAAQDAQNRAAALAAAGDFDGALRLLDESSRAYPGEESLSRERDRIAGEQAAWNRKQAISAAARRVEGLYSEGRLDEALAALGEAVVSLGDVPPLADLGQRLNAEADRRRRRDRDLQRLRELDAELQRDPEAQSLDRAADVCGRAGSEWRGDSEIEEAAAALREHVAAIRGVREAVERKDHERAATLCAAGLRGHPQHAFFDRALREAEAVERQRQSEFLAGIDSRLASEPDLDRRIEILKGALRVYPGDPHLQLELRFHESRRKLVDSVVAKARAHESAGEYDEALEQWNAMASAYREYRGLDEEIRRITALRDARESKSPPEPSTDPAAETRLFAPPELPRAMPRTVTEGADSEDYQDAVTLLMPGPSAEEPPRRRNAPWLAVAAGAAGIAASALIGVAVFRNHTATTPPVPTQSKIPPEPQPAPAALPQPPSPAPLETGASAPVERPKEADRVEEKHAAAPTDPLPCYLDISGAEPGAEVRVDGQRIGEVGPKGTLTKTVPAGTRTVELTKDGYTPADFSARFVAGARFRPTREQLALSKLPKAPPPPDPRQIENDDWQRVANSGKPEDFDGFLRLHPDGAHANEARAHAAQLRQQIQANAARKAEDDAWARVDKSNKAELQEFIAHYGTGPHANEAHDKITAIQQSEKLAAEAQKARAAKEERERDEQRAAQRLAADQQSVGRALKTLEDAYNRKDPDATQAIWTGMPPEVRRQFKEAKLLEFQIRPTAPADINGDSAQVACARSLHVTFSGVPPQKVDGERVIVRLDRRPNGWVVRSITKY